MQDSIYFLHVSRFPNRSALERDRAALLPNREPGSTGFPIEWQDRRGFTARSQATQEDVSMEGDNEKDHEALCFSDVPAVQRHQRSNCATRL